MKLYVKFIYDMILYSLNDNMDFFFIRGKRKSYVSRTAT